MKLAVLSEKQRSDLIKFFDGSRKKFKTEASKNLCRMCFLTKDSDVMIEGAIFAEYQDFIISGPFSYLLKHLASDPCIDVYFDVRKVSSEAVMAGVKILAGEKATSEDYRKKRPFTYSDDKLIDSFRLELYNFAHGLELVPLFASKRPDVFGRANYKPKSDPFCERYTDKNVDWNFTRGYSIILFVFESITTN